MIALRNFTRADLLRAPTTVFARGKATSSSRRWMDRQSSDHYTKKSISEGYRSRAAYKLLEINQKYPLFKHSTKNILDLGFAPGAWTQVALAESARRGVAPRVLGVDLINCAPPTGLQFLQGDIFSRKTHGEIDAFFEDAGIDLVLSDMMSNSSGDGELDHFASMDICEGVLILAARLLQKQGSLVMKYFTGSQDGLMIQRLEADFDRVYRMKPKACRLKLREMYVVALGKKLKKTFSMGGDGNANV